jgi:hypothetical protein
MPLSTQEKNQQALSKLKESLPLLQQDVFSIASAFAFLPDQDQLLTKIHSHNQKLAESLLVFRLPLQQAKAGEDLENVLDHFCIMSSTRMARYLSS